MEEALAEYLRHLALEKNASAHTVKSYREDLAQAIEFFRTRLGNQAPRPEQLTTRLPRNQDWLMLLTIPIIRRVVRFSSVSSGGVELCA